MRDNSIQLYSHIFAIRHTIQERKMRKYGPPLQEHRVSATVRNPSLHAYHSRGISHGCTREPMILQHRRLVLSISFAAHNSPSTLSRIAGACRIWSRILTETTGNEQIRRTGVYISVLCACASYTTRALRSFI